MRMTDALITVSMLSLYNSKNGQDYLDLLLPFVGVSLPLKIGDVVNENLIMLKMREEYGFPDFPHNVLVYVLKRLCKFRHGYLEKRGGNFHLKKSYDDTDFLAKRNRMKELLTEIVLALAGYLENQNGYKKVTPVYAESALISFFEQYGLYVVCDIVKLNALTPKGEHLYYHVGRFILHEHESKSIIFERIMQLTRGFFAYRAIYYFSSVGDSSTSTNLSNTTLYFDTPLLIDCLGYDSSDAEDAVMELMQLIKSQNGTIATFDHCVEEFDGILHAYANRTDVDSFSLKTLRDSNYDKVNLKRLSESLHINLRTKGIETRSIPPYVVSNDVQTNCVYIDEKGLTDELSKVMMGSDGQVRTKAISRDVTSVAAISRLREKSQKCQIENCKAIFVTRNTALIESAYNLEKQRFQNGEIPFVISDIELTAILWLGSFDSQTNLAKTKLIENAYAACEPSREMMDAFNNQLAILKKEGVVTHLSALVLRLMPSLQERIVEDTENDIARVTREYIQELDRRLATDLDLVLINERLKNQEDNKRRRTLAYKKAEEQAGKTADAFAARVKKFVFGALIIVCVLGICISIIPMFSSKSVTTVGWIIAVASFLLATLSTIDYFVTKRDFIFSWIKKVRNSKFDEIYATQLELLSSFNDEVRSDCDSVNGKK